MLVSVRGSTKTFRRPSFTLFPVVALLLVSCSVGEYLGAYFNTFYNAQRLFSEAEEEILKQRDLKQADTTFLPAFNLSGTTKTKLTSVVEKCSKLLQYHPESGLVDDALMMIGKSYFYQNELQKAERKFGELSESFPNSDLVEDAKLHLSYSHYRMNDKERAVAIVSELADSTREVNSEIRSKAFIVLGRVQFEEGEFGEARRSYHGAARYATTGEERSEAYAKVAEMYIREKNYSGALDAYREAEDASPSYVPEFRSRLGQARMLVKLIRYEEALDILEDLRSNTNFREFFAEIDLEIANTYSARGDIDEAVAQYTYIDTTYSRTETAAESHYRLGYLYESILHNYDSALVTYNRGKTQFPQAPITQVLATRAEHLTKHKALSLEIAKLESIKTVILNPPEQVQPSTDSSIVDTLSAESTTDTTSLPLAQPPLPSLDSVNTVLARDKAELGALFYGSFKVADSAEVWYMRLLREHPTSPYTPRALYTVAQIYSQDSLVSPSVVDSLYKEVVSRYSDSEFADEARKILGLPERERKTDEADLLYSRAQEKLDSDSIGAAIALYRAIVDLHRQSPLAAKAQYAIGWIYEQLRPNPDSAIANYQRLVNMFPSTTYALLVTPKLNEVRSQKGTDGTPQPAKDEGVLTFPSQSPDSPVDSGASGKTDVPISPLPDRQEFEILDEDTTWGEEPLEEPDPE